MFIHVFVCLFPLLLSCSPPLCFHAVYFWTSSLQLTSRNSEHHLLLMTTLTRHRFTTHRRSKIVPTVNASYRSAWRSFIIKWTVADRARAGLFFTLPPTRSRHVFVYYAADIWRESCRVSGWRRKNESGVLNVPAPVTHRHSISAAQRVTGIDYWLREDPICHTRVLLGDTSSNWRFNGTFGLRSVFTSVPSNFIPGVITVSLN